MSFIEDMKVCGMVLSSKLLSFEIIVVLEKIVEQLYIFFYVFVYEIKCICLVDDVLMVFESVYVFVNLVKGLIEFIVNDFFYCYIEEEFGLKIGEVN